jgi:hypothetical protein
MKTNALNQTLFQSLNDPESWLRQAVQQFMVAEAISPSIATQARTEAGNLLAVGYLNTTSLLLALSVENSLKAIGAPKKDFGDEERGMKPNPWGSGAKAHDLLSLAEGADFSLSPAQKTLLTKLTEISIWAGRYHAPRSVEHFKNSNRTNPRSLMLPDDLIVVKVILLEAAQRCGVPMTVA